MRFMPIFHARLAVAHALAETGRCSGVRTWRRRASPGHAPAHLVVLLQHLLAHLLDRAGSTVGAVKACIARWRRARPASACAFRSVAARRRSA
jgi:hypothetical protein